MKHLTFFNTVKYCFKPTGLILTNGFKKGIKNYKNRFFGLIRKSAGTLRTRKRLISLQNLLSLPTRQLFLAIHLL
jgi:hypothetical protein